MTLCKFSKMAAIWRPYRRKYAFAIWFYDVSHLWRQRTICMPNFDQISQSTAKVLLLSTCWKQTSAIFKFFFRFWLWPLHRHWYVILHRPTKFYTK